MNVGTLLTKAARSAGARLAVAQGSQRRTYREFNERVNRLANGLRSLGVRQGDNVALLMYNCPEMLEGLFAAFKLGCGAVPINFRLHPDEFSFIIGHSEATAVILSPEFNESFTEIRSRVPRVDHVLTVADADGELIDYETVLAGGSSKFEDASLAPDDVAWLFYTSGTTGRPKGAMLTHRNLLAMSLSFYADMCPSFGRDDATLHVAPLSHGSGLYALPNVGKAAAHIFPESKSFDPEQVLETIEQFRITNFFAAPTIVNRLVSSPNVDRTDLSSLKALIYGGAPMLVEDLVRAIDKLGPCLVQLYGQGETPMTITYLPHLDHPREPTDEQLRRLGSVGLARTNVEVAIFDAQGEETSSGEMGEIVTRSDVVMKGYWRNEAATVEATQNGWLHTGDVGYMDDEGYVFLVERSKDLIISGGENIYPREVEEVLIRHPAVREVAVIGVPDAEWGEAVKAVVALVTGQAVSAAELIEFCKHRVASYKKPKSVDFVDEIPKNNYGKILKKDLRAKYQTGTRTLR